MTTTLPAHSFLLPREKIQTHGIQTLSSEELLSVILGSGSKNVPVKSLAHRLIPKLHRQKKIELADLLRVKGIGVAKACQILAMIEFVERLRPSGYPVIDSLERALLQLSELRHAQREQMVCLYLNARMQLVLKETLAIGNVNQVSLTPRDIFSVIKHHPVSYLLLAHNHPSGTPLPSEEDLQFTTMIREAGNLLGVELIDHVIVASYQHYSCKEHGHLRK